LRTLCQAEDGNQRNCSKSAERFPFGIAQNKGSSRRYRDALAGSTRLGTEIAMENTPQVDRTADPLMIAEGWLKEGRNVAIATVVARDRTAGRP
jgi:hypothetical protein